MAQANRPKPEVNNVKVVVRCRPLSKQEEGQGCKVAVNVEQSRGEITVVAPARAGNREPQRTFTFDGVYAPNTTQVDVFNDSARDIVDAVLQGYNGTIFAYGQTGTGKTYTMMGVRGEPELQGIIPNSFAHVFGHIAQSEGDTSFLVRVSFLEIYNEEVRDLLSKKQEKLQLRERADIGVYVKGLLSFVVKNTDEMDKLMVAGNKNRSVGRTNMNEHSSRSHTIFSVTVEQSDIGVDKKQRVRMGKLHLVDLAGSERLSKTGATGMRKEEAANINRSLSNLGIVISALVDGKSTHIPYRNSKLTRLLQDSLGGNSKTVMIANIGPADYNRDETLNTLRYANSAKRIQNRARINEDPKDAMLRELQMEIEKLKKQLESCDSEEDEEEDESSDGEGEEGGGERKRKSKRKKTKIKRTGSALSPKAMTELQAQVEKEKSMLQASENMAKEERNKAEHELKKKEEELMKAQEEQAQLEKKLQDLQSKVIASGVSLLKETEKQRQLLEKSHQELEKRKKKESTLRKELEKKKAEHQVYKEKYSTLQEAKEGLTIQLKQAWKQVQATNDELAAVKGEYQREMEMLLGNLRELNREVRLQTLIINNFVPTEFQELIEQNCVWSEESEDWHMKFVAYTGNNMQKKESPEETKPAVCWDTVNSYLCYVETVHRPAGSSRRSSQQPLSTSSSTTTSSTARGKTSTGRRPPRTGSKASKKKPVSPSSSEYTTTSSQEFPSSRGLVTKQQHFA